MIRFEEWVTRVFDRPSINYKWWFEEETDWNEFPPNKSLKYMSRLFEESGVVLARFSDLQVDQGLWMIVGCGSDHSDAIFNPKANRLLRLSWARSTLSLYKTFAARCSQHLSHLDETGANPLNSICYMFWDILTVIERPNDDALDEVNRALLESMKLSLLLPSDACREGGLHGLGLWQENYPQEVEKFVADFIAAYPKMRPELKAYAECAQVGKVL